MRLIRKMGLTNFVLNLHLAQLVKVIGIVIILSSCSPKHEYIYPEVKDITESVYANGRIKSFDQYEAFSAVNGIVKEIFVQEGDLLRKNDPILRISADAVDLTKESAAVSRRYAEANLWSESLKELHIQIDLAKAKMVNDEHLFERQKELWKNSVGTLNQLEQMELNFKNSRIAYESLILKYNELKRKLSYDSDLAAKNLQVQSALAAEYFVRSKVDGKVYKLLKEPGELVSSQSPVALLGDAKVFILELDVDEKDIVVIKIGQKVLVHLDSYGQQVFEAVITKIGTLMDQSSRTIKTEARFLKQPKMMYPNLTTEANIIIHAMKNVLLIPRSYLVDNTYVLLENGQKRRVVTGLKDYRNVQITKGITASEKIRRPTP
ncbi:HlyD family efflux transporter periplasmic adaptor subunit [Pedobacter sp. Du54]|uniref:efflux RND transporter periplasmic adaptor subunit n=1 Tax=Pedobacter anseongensis TaxID=3133439 RepID=UPI0030B69A3B